MPIPIDPLQVVNSRRPGQMLPREAYVTSAMYEADFEAIWYQEWVFAGHSFEIPEDGQFFTLQIGDYPIVVVRNEQGDINAFVNMCRHRGSRLCPQERGDVGRIVCPYHGWTYNLDGELIYAANMGEGFDLTQHSLRRVHCQVVATYVFVCLAREPRKSLDAFESEMTRFLAPYGLEDARVAHETTVIEAGNWKLVWENNRECYHCNANHPELMNSFRETLTVAGLQGSEADEERAFTERCEAAGFPSALRIADDGQYRIVRIPFTGKALSQSLDGQYVVQNHLLTDPRGINTGNLLYFHYPSTWNHVMADYVISFRVTPLAPDRTQVTTKWLVHKDAEEGRDFQNDMLTAVWIATNAQDARLVGECHRGVASPVFEAGTMSPIEEMGPSQWLDWYCAAFAANWPHRERRMAAVRSSMAAA